MTCLDNLLIMIRSLHDKTQFVFWSLILHVLLLPTAVFAQENSPIADVNGIENPTESSSLQEFLGKILEAIVTLLYPILVLALVYSGFLFVTAQGNPQKLQKARTVLKWVIVGAVIIFARWLIADIIGTTVNEVQVN